MKKKLLIIFLVFTFLFGLHAKDNNATKIIERNYRYGDSVRINKNKKTAEISVYGTDEKLILNVVTQNLFKIQCDFEGKFTTCVAGYELEINKATFDGKELTVLEGQVKTIQGFSSEYFLINDLKLNINGITKNGIGIGEYSYSFDGWDVIFSSIQLTERGIEGPIVIDFIRNEHSLADLEGWSVNFSNFLVKSNGEIVTEKQDLDLKNSFFYVNLNEFKLGYGCFEKIDNQYHLVCDSSVLINYTIGEQSINLGKTTFSSVGNVIALEPVNYTTPILTSNDYKVYPETVCYDGENLILQGTLTPENWDYCNFESKEIYIHKNFFAEIKDPISEIEYGYLGWDIKGENATLGYKRINIESNNIFYLGTEIPLFDHEYYTNGILAEGSNTYVIQSVPIIFDNTINLQTRFSKAGLYVTLGFPLFFDENKYPITFNSVLLFPDGTFNSESVESHHSFYFKNTLFEFNHGLLKEDGLNFYSLNIEFNNRNIRQIFLDDIFISNNDDTVIIKGNAGSPIQFCNMVIVADKVTINSNEIDIIGSIQLPSSIPGALANRMIKLNEFKLELNGSPKSIDARIEGKFVIPFVDDSNLLFSSLVVGTSSDKPAIFFNDAKIKFYSKYGLEEIDLKYIIFDPALKNFIYDNIVLTESLNVKIDDIDYVLNYLTIMEEEQKLQFSGEANINGEIKKAVVEYTIDGTITCFF